MVPGTLPRPRHTPNRGPSEEDQGRPGGALPSDADGLVLLNVNVRGGPASLLGSKLRPLAARTAHRHGILAGLLTGCAAMLSNGAGRRVPWNLLVTGVPRIHGFAERDRVTTGLRKAS